MRLTGRLAARGLLGSHALRIGTDMASNYGPALVVAAGTITFANHWLQSGDVNWRVPIATLFGAGAVGVIGNFSTGAANALGIMVFIASATMQVNGKSAVSELASNLPRH